MRKLSLIVAGMGLMIALAGCGSKEKAPATNQGNTVVSDEKAPEISGSEAEGNTLGIVFTEFEPTEEMFTENIHSSNGYRKTKELFAEQVMFKLPEDESLYEVGEMEVVSPTTVWLDKYETVFDTEAYKGEVLESFRGFSYCITNKYTEWSLCFSLKINGGTEEIRQGIKQTFETALEESLTKHPALGADPELHRIVTLDYHIEEEVREILGSQAVADKPLRVIDLLFVKELELGSHCGDLSDLRYMKNLESLTLSRMYGDVDISPFAEMDLPNLKKIDLYSLNLIGFEALGTMTSLTDLKVGYCNIQDISALANLTNLTRLNLEDNKITDISALANLTNLKELYLSGNEITDISPVEFVPTLDW